MKQFRELLTSEARVPSLDDDALGALEAHYELLTRWNAKLNLTALRSLEEAVRFHYAESLFFAAQLTQLPGWPHVRRICDVGSGPGFPGVGIAALYPHIEVELVESHQRKSVFLRESTSALRNVRVMGRRFEELSGPWDVVVSRAVAWTDIAEHAIEVAGYIALLVGPKDILAVSRSRGVEWFPPVETPYGRGSVLLGCVPRET